MMNYYRFYGFSKLNLSKTLFAWVSQHDYNLHGSCPTIKDKRTNDEVGEIYTVPPANTELTSLPTSKTKSSSGWGRTDGMDGHHSSNSLLTPLSRWVIPTNIRTHRHLSLLTSSPEVSSSARLGTPHCLQVFSSHLFPRPTPVWLGPRAAPPKLLSPV